MFCCNYKRTADCHVRHREGKKGFDSIPLSLSLQNILYSLYAVLKLVNASCVREVYRHISMTLLAGCFSNFSEEDCSLDKSIDIGINKILTIPIPRQGGRKERSCKLSLRQKTQLHISKVVRHCIYFPVLLAEIPCT